MPSHKPPVRRMQDELRWAASAHALITRPDRTASLLHRLEQLPARRAHFEEAYSEFLATVEDDEARESAQKDYEQFFEFTDDVLEAGAKMKREARQSMLCESPRPQPQPALLGRLPTLDLPHFGGRLQDWMGFISIFDSLVHTRRDLSPGQKMAYLRTSLQGEALGVVCHLKLSDASYSTARELLERRYANVRRLADAHMMELISLPVLKDLARLREVIIDPVVVACNALRQLDLPVDQWSFWLLHLVLSRLPLDLRIRFEERYGGDGANYIPPFSDLLKFLEEQSRQVENAVASGTPAKEPARPTPPSKPTTSTRGSKQPELAQETGRRPILNFSGLAATEVTPCHYCRASTHTTTDCPKFLERPPKSRRAIARERRWCYSCLGRHLQRNCQHQRPCPHCQGNHLPILCLDRNGVGRQEVVERTPGRSGVSSPVTGPADRRRGDTVSAAPGFDRASPPPRAGVQPSRGGGVPPSVNPEGGFAVAQPDPRRYSPPLAEYPRLQRHLPRWPGHPLPHYAAPRLSYMARPPQTGRDAWVYPGGTPPLGVVEVPQEGPYERPRLEELPERGNSR